MTMTEAPAAAARRRPRPLDYLRLDNAPPPPLADQPAPRWAGLAVIAFDIGDLGRTASFSNLWSQGGFLPFGIVGVLLTLQIGCLRTRA